MTHWIINWLDADKSSTWVMDSSGHKTWIKWRYDTNTLTRFMQHQQYSKSLAMWHEMSNNVEDCVCYYFGNVIYYNGPSYLRLGIV